MRKVLVVFMLSVGWQMAQAEDYGYLTFETNSGTKTAVSVTSLTLTVADGKLIATNADGSLSFVLSDLSKMYFSASSTDIATIKAVNGEVEVYSLGGLYQGRFENSTVALSSLRRGVYIVKSEQGTFKVAVQ